jgi:replicative DNA helicase
MIPHPGKEASKTLEKELKELGIYCSNFYDLIEKNKEESEYLETLLKIKDPNDALKNNKDKFEQALLYAYTTTKFNYNKFFKKVYKDAKIEIEKMDPSDEKKEVLEYIKSSITKPALATGFYKLDEILNGGLKGGCLYGIGSVPSLGKTTLIMQIADYIAEHNRRNVCIFSLEMSKNDLMLKSIVRETYKKSSMSELTKSVSEIFKINNDDEYNKLTEDEYFKEGLNHYFNEINPYIYISEGIGDIDIKKVNERIKYFADNKPNDELPMIIIDYVQILSPYITDDNFKTKYITDKQILDKNIMELKRIARDKNIPIIAISSFNRDSYESETNFKSFKESGAIEYSSDVIIGLQLKMDRSKKLSEDEKLKQINKSKNKNPREVELVILKNRFGKAYKQISFKYYPQHDFFEENEKTEKLCSGQEIFIKKRGRVRSLYEKE